MKTHYLASALRALAAGIEVGFPCIGYGAADALRGLSRNMGDEAPAWLARLIAEVDNIERLPYAAEQYDDVARRVHCAADSLAQM